MTTQPVAMVTGGAVRVGEVISRSLAEAGYDLVVHYNSSQSAARQLVAELEGSGHAALEVAADISEGSQRQRLLETAMAKFGRLDLLVNNAAVFGRRPLLEVNEELWRRTLEVDLTGAFLLAQGAARIMWGAGHGRIINICGTSGIGPIGAYAPYCVAKAGLDMLTCCMAQALAPRVQVNGVAPGTVLFPEGTTPRQKERIIRRIPAGHAGSPDDVAAAVCFLATAPDYITGTIIRVDGGASLVG
ncbi:MAG: SDR family oxidoreductase [Acidobacteriota bacterium]